MLFKVTTAEGRGCVAGSEFVYPLPSATRAGAWTAPIDDPSVCNRGYHLTSRPDRWWNTSSRRIFLAEHRGALAVREDKVAAAQVRLVQEITPEWPLLPLFPVCRALLMNAWRMDHHEAAWPAWANLRGADLRGANLGGANLGGADLRGADLRGADLRGADLGGADLRRADLGGANLGGANLGGANLGIADLRGADLRGAHLGGADLRGADLGGANLDGANLGGADLRGADLGGANLGGADLRGDLAARGAIL